MDVKFYLGPSKSSKTLVSYYEQVPILCCSNPITPKISKDEDEANQAEMLGKPKAKTELQYGVSDIPPPHLCFLFGLQQVLLSISSTISVPLVVSINICAGDLALVKSEIMSTFLFMCGVCTILQCALGVRLPILQGGCHKFLPAIAALMALDQWKCPDMAPYLAANSTLDAGEIWKPRMREIQGGIIIASLFQIFIGCSGLLGVILQFIGPITIVPTISLVGLSLIDVALMFCQKHWGISFMTVALLLLFSLYLKNVNIPFPSYSKSEKCHIIQYPVFKLLPVILAVAITWGLCTVLTHFDVGPAAVRTDTKSSAIRESSWFFWPYPGQWGMPTISVAGVMAMLAVTIASMIESVGDYYACARISEVPPPPAHAVNRGVFMEGLGSLISGAVGSGGATTSYSQNVGAIGFTKVASRFSFYAAGLIFLVAGIIGKVGAFLTTMPDPILGGIILVSFGMVISVGLSALSFVDLGSSRNLTIIGVSMMVGLMVPRYVERNPNIIQTGDEDADRVITVLLGTAMFVGAFVAFILDNTVPGSDEERGVKKWRQLAQASITLEDLAGEEMNDVTSNPEKDLHQSGDEQKTQPPVDTTAVNVEIAMEGALSLSTADIYDIPFITPYLRKVGCFRYWPFLPTFAYGTISLNCRKKKNHNS